MKLKTHEEFEQELFNKEIDYWPLDKYQGAKTSIRFTCLKEHIWKTTPDHILRGSGCPDCAGVRLKTDAEYKLSLANRNLKPLEPYINDGTKLLHECIVCSHRWEATPSHILQGRGCPLCNYGSFKLDKPGRLYFISLEKDGVIYYKIGITNHSVRRRFSGDWSRLNISVLWEIFSEDGKYVFDLERSLKQKHTFLKDLNILKYGGNTELLSYKIEKPL